MNMTGMRWWLGILVLLLAGGWAGCGGDPTPVATLEQPQGKIEAKPGPNDLFKACRGGEPLAVGGAVRTGDDGHGQVKFRSGSLVSLEPETIFTIGENFPQGRQDSGAAIFQVTPQQKEFGIETPHGVTAVLGTLFRQEVTPDKLVLTVMEGKVRFVSTASEAIEVGAGKQLTVERGKALNQPGDADPASFLKLFNASGPNPALNDR